MLLAKEGVKFSVITEAGLYILSALMEASRKLGQDLTITSACDGVHSGPNDPHPLGNAYDVRSRNFTDKVAVLLEVMNQLGTDPQPSSGGYVTEKFFGWLEDPNGTNEHFHFQLRRGVTFT